MAGDGARPRQIGGEKAESQPIEGNPYVGLSAFTEADADRFFGRDAIIEKLRTDFCALVAAVGTPRVLPILGPSGSGKSSVARAGLLPALTKNAPRQFDKARVAVMTPRAAPLRELARVLARVDPSDRHDAVKIREIESVLREPDRQDPECWNGLDTVADSLAGDASSSLIMLVDQFEEIYTLTADVQERRMFVANLLEAASKPGGRVFVILTMRSDFIGATATHPELNALVADRGVIVPAMTEAELREAIETPAKRSGHPLPAAVVSALLEETRGRVGALPLLQFALERLWAGMAAGRDAGEVLVEIGGVGGALAREAERIFTSLSPEDRNVARRAFLSMVALGEGVNDTRRRAPLSEIVAADETPDDVRRVLEAFARKDERLVSLSGSEDEIAAEVTHEALFEHWQTLRGWLDEGREDIRFQRQLNEAIDAWEEADRAHGTLWRPPQLTRLEEFATRNEADMTAAQLAFLQSSRKAVARGRLFQLGSLAVALLALVAIGFGWFAWTQREAAIDARLQADEERTRALAIQSRFLAELSWNRTQSDDATEGALIALAALEDWRPQAREPEAALASALMELREAIIPRGLAPAFEIVGFSPDGRHVVLDGGLENPEMPAFAFDIEGRALLELPESWQQAELAVHPTEPVIAVAEGFESVRLHSIPDWTPIAELSSPPRPDVDGLLFGDIRFSSDGTVLYQAVLTNWFRRWSVPDHSALPDWTLDTPVAQFGDGAASLRFPEQETVALGGRFGFAAYRTDVEPPRMISERIGRYVQASAISPGQHDALCAGDCLFAIVVDAGIEFYEISNGSAIPFDIWPADDIGVELPGSHVTFTANGTGFVVSDQIGAAKWAPIQITVSGGEKTVAPAQFVDVSPDPAAISTAGSFRVAGSEPPPIAISPDGAYMAVGSSYGQIALWATPEGGPPVRITTLKFGNPTLGVSDLAFSPDSARLASLDEEGAWRIWPVHSAHGRIIDAGHLHATAVAFNRDRTLVAAGGAKGHLRIWDLQSGGPSIELAGHANWIHSIVFSQDGTELLTAAEEDSAIIWNLSDHSITKRIRNEDIWLADLSPDGRSIVTSGEIGDASVRSRDGRAIATNQLSTQWEVEVTAVSYVGGQPIAVLRVRNSDTEYPVVNVETGEQLGTLNNPDERPELHFEFPVAVSENRIAIARRDGSVAVFAVPAADRAAPLLGVVPAHIGRQVTAISIADAADRMVTAASDGYVRLWNLDTMSEVATIIGPLPNASAAAISEDGETIAATFGRSLARPPQLLGVWAVPRTQTEIIESARALVHRELTDAERREYFISID